MVRVAVLDKLLCKPNKCNLECIRFCPIVRSGAKAIEISEDSKKPMINEILCVGCGICVKKCPFTAITIVNLPDELEEDAIHRYGPNAFKLYRLPIPKPGMITGIIGRNGTGKTTALRILAGELKPNLGKYGESLEWDDIIRSFRGSELQVYFKKLADGKVKVAHKIQHVDLVPRYVKGKVGDLLEKADERGLAKELAKQLGLISVWDRSIEHLSGGELQKFLIAAVLLKDVDVYLFDEPCSYLDVYERLRIAKIIREHTSKRGKMVLLVEHDIAVLDYLSDNVHVIYGEPGVYGIVSHPYGVRTGINNFLDGFLPDENMKIRDEPVRFTVKPPIQRWADEKVLLEWTTMKKTLGDFKLNVEAGRIHKGEVIGILGPNGIGKTTFVRILVGELKPEEGLTYSVEGDLKLSYKPQYVTAMIKEGVVKELIANSCKEALDKSSWMYNEILLKLGVDKLLDRDVKGLSGGELQKVAITITLVKEADIYLLDEPSAYLDVEERLNVAKAIRKTVEHRGAAAFVVEHDVVIQDFIATTIMPFLGEPGVEGYAYPPMDLRSGMNKFLETVQVTFRRDVKTRRPRVNKEGSYLDRQQKMMGEYYYVET